MNEITWPAILGPLFAGHSLDSEQSAWAMRSIMEGEATPAQFGAFVAGLRAKGESVDEIIGLVNTMREMSQKVVVDGPLLDTCGTGGDRSGTINVSTIAALVAAGAEVRVAKHGNRAASSACGSADLLEELGVKIDLGPQGVAACIEGAGIGFCFAPIFHPSMRHAANARREIGVPTVFNFLGPLTNPAGVRDQVLGVSDPKMAPKMAEVLRRLGGARAMVVHGSDGIDEITTTGPSHVWHLRDGEIVEWDIDPAELGISASVLGDLRGGDAPENARIARMILGGEQGAGREVVALNAAAGLFVAGAASDLREGLAQARESIDSGAALKALEAMVRISNLT